MTTSEIALAQAYLAASGHDPITALIRSVRDNARMRRLLSGRSEFVAVRAALPPMAAAVARA